MTAKVQTLSFFRSRSLPLSRALSHSLSRALSPSFVFPSLQSLLDCQYTSLSLPRSLAPSLPPAHPPSRSLSRSLSLWCLVTRTCHIPAHTGTCPQLTDNLCAALSLPLPPSTELMAHLVADNAQNGSISQQLTKGFICHRPRLVLFELLTSHESGAVLGLRGLGEADEWMCGC